ncbi:MAG TPA: AMP-binding protein, partial [Thermoanaerobaculia bacterium]|nr:AMP-binding protein [Thermoanaerobaculia bacterium]
GVVQSHGMIATQALAAAAELSYREDDRCLVTGATTLGSGLSNVHQALVAGAAVAYFPVETEGLAGLAGFLGETRVTVLHMVPSVFRRFLSTAGPAARFPGVRLVRVSSDAVLRRDFDLYRTHFPNAPALRVNLALTETGTICSHLVARDAVVEDGAIPVGPPVAGVTIDIEDEERRPVAPGEAGEIVVRREWLADGYWRDPELTAQRFPVSPDGTRRCRTGDLARLRPDGTYAHSGRKDFQVKIRGVRVHIGEVEAALASVPGVGDVAATAFDEPSGEKSLVGYFEGDPAAVPPSPREREILRARLPAAFVPRAFVVLPEFPRTPTGKVNRRALPPPPAAAESADGAAPSDVVESTLLEIWRLLLPGPVSGVRDDFFESGGDSLIAAEMLAGIERRFGRQLPLPILLDAPTIEALAKVLRAPAPAAEAGSPIVALRETGSRLPFFCVPGGNGPGFNFRTIARLLGNEQPFYAFHVVTETGEPMPESIEAWADRFLPALTAVQPRGPYRIGGHSFGGTVAWEMAKRLAAAGEPVEILALLDTFAPGYPPPAPPVRRAADLWRRFRSLSWKGRAAALRRRIARRLRPAPLGRALRAYEPTNLPLPVVLFRARDQVRRAGRLHDDPDNGWRAIPGIRLRTVVVPGTHDTLIEAEGAEAIAAVLGPLLGGVSDTASAGPRGGTDAEPRRAAS